MALHRGVEVEKLSGKIYLDTSSVRSAGSNLSKVNKDRRAMTSIHAISELMNGLRANQGDFERRRGALRNIISSKLTIDWRSPDMVLLVSFGASRKYASRYLSMFRDQVERPMKLIINAAIKADNLNNFNMLIESMGLCGMMNAIEEHDNKSSRLWVEVFSTGNRDLKEKIDMVYGYSGNKEFAHEMLNENEFINIYGTLYVLSCRVQKILLSLNFLKEPISWSSVCATYDCSFLDVYCGAMGQYHMDKLSNMGDPGRNDGADVKHFLYLTSNMIFLTEDGLQRNLAESCGVKWFSVADFLARFRSSCKQSSSHSLSKSAVSS